MADLIGIYTRFFHAFPIGWKNLRGNSCGQDRRDAIRLLSDMAEASGLDTCEEALQIAAANNRSDLGSIRQCFEVITRQELYPEPLQTTTPVPVPMPTEADLRHYDNLTGGVASA